MSDDTIKALVETRKRIIKEVNQGKLSVKDGARLLGMTRQGFWKLRKNVQKYGMEKAVVGRKRGPLPGCRIWNRTPAWIEEKVEELWYDTGGVGPDRLVWLLEDSFIKISRSTVYRILVRRRLIIPKEKEVRKPAHLYTKGYPGEEVQIDTTEPFGKGKGILISAIDDYSRWGEGELYYGNTSLMASLFLKELVLKAPFPIKAVRVDNGGEFKGEFERTCQTLGIEIIRNPVHSPQKNGKVERFHRTIEEECLWRVNAEKHELEYGRYWLTRYLSWYNNKRKHGGLGMNGKTPREKIEQWILKNKTEENYQDVNETMILYKS